MRPIIAGLLIMCLFIITAYTACIKDECTGITCYNEGVCVDRVCACPKGFEGGLCETQWVDKFAGNWAAQDRYQKDTTNSLYSYNIAVTGQLDSFFVSGLIDTAKDVKCKLSSLYEFTIAEQVLDSALTIKSGKGVYDKVKNAVTGLYTYRFRGRENGAVKIDTTMTVNFTWTR